MLRFLDRKFLRLPCYIALCTSERAFNAEMKRRGISRDEFKHFLPPRCVACVHHMVDDDGRRIEMVCIDGEQSKKSSLLSVYLTLTHEAVHVWQTMRDAWGEQEPSSEFEAYSIESITELLVLAYLKQVKRGRK